MGQEQLVVRRWGKPGEKGAFKSQVCPYRGSMATPTGEMWYYIIVYTDHRGQRGDNFPWLPEQVKQPPNTVMFLRSKDVWREMVAEKFRELRKCCKTLPSESVLLEERRSHASHN